MSGREFLAMWACCIGATALIVGWVFLSVSVFFPHSPPAAIVSGVGVPLVVLMGGMWLVVRS